MSQDTVHETLAEYRYGETWSIRPPSRPTMSGLINNVAIFTENLINVAIQSTGLIFDGFQLLFNKPTGTQLMIELYS